ncbi:hypothetical protein K8Z61_11490 [Nocardioides sp. TRM66260-LWL]|uniref:hypothetical protein n=1 Tax=Nocardioides sp. TRM66260-LWL TaxID=2874478 RepID=UPI001CC4D0A0|nr:hypothetical protein [Nocardioides sp. TRM66260-LWL]MBZ5735121.1 hypothetical protein [Nocardioides sp. TRM66260-LWL]
MTEERLVERAPLPRPRLLIGGTHVLDEIQGAAQVLANLLLANFHGAEPLLSARALTPEPLLLASEQVQRHGTRVVSLQQLGLLVLHRAQLRQQRLALALLHGRDLVEHRSQPGFD